MNIEYTIIGFLLIYILVQAANQWKSSFKLGYYETKLENQGVDISHIKNISLQEIIKL